MLKRIFCPIIIAVCISCIASADWNPGDAYKMHHPQEPNANGWDVCLYNEIADDFMCTETGAIDDIHFWISYEADVNAIVNQWVISIAADVCGLPGNILWTWDDSGNVNIIPYGQGLQGWYCPATAVPEPNDHSNFWQVNITEIGDTFVQQQGQIYWLIIRAVVQDYPQKAVGWKSSTTQFFSSAMWKDPTSGWQPLSQIGYPDMAFVISGDFECVKRTAPFYNTWVGGSGQPWSKPDCWCYQRQCRGDADGKKQLGAFWVYTADFSILKDAYAKLTSQMTGNRICADFDHSISLSIFPVYTGDLAILRAYYTKVESQVPVCGSYYYNFWTSP